MQPREAWLPIRLVDDVRRSAGHAEGGHGSLIEKTAGETPAAEVVGTISRATGGNPYAARASAFN